MPEQPLSGEAVPVPFVPEAQTVYPDFVAYPGLPEGVARVDDAPTIPMILGGIGLISALTNPHYVLAYLTHTYRQLRGRVTRNREGVPQPPKGDSAVAG